jgi:hypothetical protein
MICFRLVPATSWLANFHPSLRDLAPWRLGGFGLNPPLRPKDLVRSIDLVVCADAFQDKGRLALVFRQPKHDAEIVTTAGRP